MGSCRRFRGWWSSSEQMRGIQGLGNRGVLVYWIRGVQVFCTNEDLALWTNEKQALWKRETQAICINKGHRHKERIEN